MLVVVQGRPKKNEKGKILKNIWLGGMILKDFDLGMCVKKF